MTFFILPYHQLLTPEPEVHPGNDKAGRHKHDQAINGWRNGHHIVVQQRAGNQNTKGAVLNAGFNGNGNALGNVELCDPGRYITN